MKPIDVTNIYRKSYRKLVESNNKLRNKVIERIDLFIEDRSNPILKDHGLKGSMEGFRSFSVTGDVRILYTETETHYVFQNIGTHSQVY